ncbi:AAA family ATPase [uncultured Aquimarina sp.]|uniref:AAA family ATPase n=1 Tax=uncultured Aquimarina sp. TaxID=575652 RepID=UPI0026020D31|nr:AAA family ATPase [uncultured Aquimarina sp.]
MKIIIFGASGSGTTTLAQEIEKRTDFIHLDVDDYYWKKTTPPFQEKTPLIARNKRFKADFKNFENVVVSGSLVTWGKEWETSFDLAIFMILDNKKRMDRLYKREKERYGEKLFSDKKTQQISKAFLEWANQYENPNFDGRSLKIHYNWIKLLHCKVLRIDGETALNDKTKKVLTEIKRNTL